MTSLPTKGDSRLERQFARFVLLAVLVVNAVALSGELSVGRVTGSDNISHLSLLRGMVRAVENGENPLDFWSPEGSLGSAPMRTYQPLAHALVALVYFGLGKTVSLLTLFVFIRYLVVVLLPAGFFAAARLLELPPLVAAASAVLSPLIATDAIYGLDYSSYVSTGRGLFPQSLAAVLLLLAIGYGFRAIRTGRSWVWAGALLGLTCICHFIYGWIGAVTVSLAALLPDPAVGRWLRIRRTVCVGSIALAVSAFQLLPVWIDHPILNRSRWEGTWKYDSFGMGAVLKLLFTGELLDHGRLPVLSLLALLGAGLVVWNFRRTRRLSPPQLFVIASAVFWLLVFFGRPTWGPLLLLLGVGQDLHLHRTVGAVQVFLVLLAALGMGTLWRELTRRGYVAAALLITLFLLAPMLVERSRYLARNETQGTEVRVAYDTEKPVLDAVIADVKQAGGRVYAGSARNWGTRFPIGGIPFFAFLNMDLVPQVSASYEMLALTAEILPLFDDRRPAQFRLFNVRSVVAPASLVSGMPGFLSPRVSIGRYQIFNAPGAGYFDIVDVAAVVQANKENFYDWNERWLQSDWVDRRTHLWLDFRGDAPSSLPRVPANGALAPLTSPPTSAGEIRGERQHGEEYQAEFAVSRPGYVLFKMTWHPNWTAYVDGKVQKTAMLSPGLVGVPVVAGQHNILLRYEPGMWKLWMAFAGFLLVLLAGAAERKGYLTL